MQLEIILHFFLFVADFFCFCASDHIVESRRVLNLQDVQSSARCPLLAQQNRQITGHGEDPSRDKYMINAQPGQSGESFSSYIAM